MLIGKDLGCLFLINRHPILSRSGYPCKVALQQSLGTFHLTLLKYGNKKLKKILKIKI
jgi:hypothetical protein